MLAHQRFSTQGRGSQNAARLCSTIMNKANLLFMGILNSFLMGVGPGASFFCCEIVLSDSGVTDMVVEVPKTSLLIWSRATFSFLTFEFLNLIGRFQSHVHGIWYLGSKVIRMRAHEPKNLITNFLILWLFLERPIQVAEHTVQLSERRVPRNGSQNALFS